MQENARQTAGRSNRSHTRARAVRANTPAGLASSGMFSNRQHSPHVPQVLDPASSSLIISPELRSSPRPRSPPMRAKQSISTPAAEASRARTQLLTEMRDPGFATVVGKLHTMNKLTLAQYNTAKKWASLVNDYSRALQTPKPPASVRFDKDHGAHPADPTSEAGRREAARHRRIRLAYDEAIGVLCPGLVRVLDHIVVRDGVPTSLFDLGNLKVALDHLADHWSDRRKARFE